MKAGLLIIDMLNEYLTPEGKIYCESCRNIIPNICEARKLFAENGLPVFFINTALEPTDTLVQKWGPHALMGSRMAETVEELSPSADDMIVLKKGYDGFFNTTLEEQLRENDVDLVVVTGIHTHVCVLLTAVGAFQRGFSVVTLSDCITTGYQPNHDTRLRFFVSHLGELLSLAEWRKRGQ